MARRKKASDSNIGYYAFLLGILIAVIAGLVAASGNLSLLEQETVLLVLIILGLVVGLLNLIEKDVTAFLLAVIALTAVGATGGTWIAGAGGELLPYIGLPLSIIVKNIAAFVSPAAVIVAIKTIWDLATI